MVELLQSMSSKGSWKYSPKNSNTSEEATISKDSLSEQEKGVIEKLMKEDGFEEDKEKNLKITVVESDVEEGTTQLALQFVTDSSVSPMDEDTTQDITKLLLSQLGEVIQEEQSLKEERKNQGRA